MRAFGCEDCGALFRKASDVTDACLPYVGAVQLDRELTEATGDDVWEWSGDELPASLLRRLEVRS